MEENDSNLKLNLLVKAALEAWQNDNQLRKSDEHTGSELNSKIQLRSPLDANATPSKSKHANEDEDLSTSNNSINSSLPFNDESSSGSTEDFKTTAVKIRNTKEKPEISNNNNSQHRKLELIKTLFLDAITNDKNLLPDPNQPKEAQSETVLNEVNTKKTDTKLNNNNTSSSTRLLSCYPMFIGKNGKPTRPFKAYPKEPLSMPLGYSPTFTNMPFELNGQPGTGDALMSSAYAAFNTDSSDFFNLHYRKRIEQAKSRIETRKKNAQRPKKPKKGTEKPEKIETEAKLEENQQVERIISTPVACEAPKSEEKILIEEWEDLKDSSYNSISIHGTSLIPPPKKRHRVQQLEELKIEHKNLEMELKRQQQEQERQQEQEKLMLDALNSAKLAKMPSLVHDSASSQSPLSIPTTPTSLASSSPSSSDSAFSSGATMIVGDDSYRERRRKNNEAAKRSRDARRAKEDEIALRAAILERENLQLKVELAQLKQETSKLRCMLYNS